ncbi:MAG: hypothetical protein E7L09_10795 [Enterobacteriaceae bacterium]|nr:hypothetical protein [Enterobacteriaceae bacterium]
MLALIVFVLIIGISSLTFIKLKRKYSQSRSGVFNTWIIPSIMAFLCFSVLMILAAIVIPKSELKQNTSERISVNQFNDNNEKILNQEFKSGIDSFFTPYLQYSDTDMEIDFDNFNNQIQYLFKVSGIKVDYTSKKKAYTYQLPGKINMVVLVNIQTNKINYLGMMFNSHEGGNLSTFVISNMKIMMVLQKTTNPHDIQPFLEDLSKNGDGQATLGQNEYRFYSKNGTYLLLAK